MANRHPSRISGELDILKKETGINSIRSAVHDAEEWVEKEVHKSSEVTSDTLDALKRRINDLNKSLHRLEHSGSGVVSDEAHSIGQSLHEAGEDISIFEDKIMRKIMHLLQSYPDGLTIAGIIKKLTCDGIISRLWRLK